MTPNLSRNTDPMSSHRGADHVINSGQLESQVKMIYDALTTHPRHTARELSSATGIDYYVIQKRLSTLRKRNLAQVVSERICTVSKTKIPAQVWEAK